MAGQSQADAPDLPGQRSSGRPAEPERDRLLLPQPEPGLPENGLKSSAVYCQVSQEPYIYGSNINSGLWWLALKLVKRTLFSFCPTPTLKLIEH